MFLFISAIILLFNCLPWTHSQCTTRVEQHTKEVCFHERCVNMTYTRLGTYCSSQVVICRSRIEYDTKRVCFDGNYCVNMTYTRLGNTCSSLVRVSPSAATRHTNGISTNHASVSSTFSSGTVIVPTNVNQHSSITTTHFNHSASSRFNSSVLRTPAITNTLNRNSTQKLNTQFSSSSTVNSNSSHAIRNNSTVVKGSISRTSVIIGTSLNTKNTTMIRTPQVTKTSTLHLTVSVQINQSRSSNSSIKIETTSHFSSMINSSQLSSERSIMTNRTAIITLTTLTSSFSIKPSFSTSLNSTNNTVHTTVLLKNNSSLSTFGSSSQNVINKTSTSLIFSINSTDLATKSLNTSASQTMGLKSSVSTDTSLSSNHTTSQQVSISATPLLSSSPSYTVIILTSYTPCWVNVTYLVNTTSERIIPTASLKSTTTVFRNVSEVMTNTVNATKILPTSSINLNTTTTTQNMSKVITDTANVTSIPPTLSVTQNMTTVIRNTSEIIAKTVNSRITPSTLINQNMTTVVQSNFSNMATTTIKSTSNVKSSIQLNVSQSTNISSTSTRSSLVVNNTVITQSQHLHTVSTNTSSHLSIISTSVPMNNGSQISTMNATLVASSKRIQATQTTNITQLLTTFTSVLSTSNSNIMTRVNNVSSSIKASISNISSISMNKSYLSSIGGVITTTSMSQQLTPSVTISTLINVSSTNNHKASSLETSLHSVGNTMNTTASSFILATANNSFSTRSVSTGIATTIHSLNGNTVSKTPAILSSSITANVSRSNISTTTARSQTVVINSTKSSNTIENNNSTNVFQTSVAILSNVTTLSSSNDKIVTSATIANSVFNTNLGNSEIRASQNKSLSDSLMTSFQRISITQISFISAPVASNTSSNLPVSTTVIKKKIGLRKRREVQQISSSNNTSVISNNSLSISNSIITEFQNINLTTNILSTVSTNTTSSVIRETIAPTPSLMRTSVLQINTSVNLSNVISETTKENLTSSFQTISPSGYYVVSSSLSQCPVYYSTRVIGKTSNFLFMTTTQTTTNILTTTAPYQSVAPSQTNRTIDGSHLIKSSTVNKNYSMNMQSSNTALFSVSKLHNMSTFKLKTTSIFSVTLLASTQQTSTFISATSSIMHVNTTFSTAKQTHFSSREFTSSNLLTPTSMKKSTTAATIITSASRRSKIQVSNSSIVATSSILTVMYNSTDTLTNKISTTTTSRLLTPTKSFSTTSKLAPSTKSISTTSKLAPSTKGFSTSTSYSSTNTTTSVVTPSIKTSVSLTLIQNKTLVTDSVISISTMTSSQTPSVTTSSSVSVLPVVTTTPIPRDYNVKIVLTISSLVDVTTVEFKSKLEQDLVDTYVSMNALKVRRKRRVAYNGNTSVEITDIKRRNQNVDVKFTVEEENVKVPPLRAAAVYNYLSPTGLQKRLGYQVTGPVTIAVAPALYSDMDVLGMTLNDVSVYNFSLLSTQEDFQTKMAQNFKNRRSLPGTTLVTFKIIFVKHELGDQVYLEFYVSVAGDVRNATFVASVYENIPAPYTELTTEIGVTGVQVLSVPFAANTFLYVDQRVNIIRIVLKPKTANTDQTSRTYKENLELKLTEIYMLGKDTSKRKRRATGSVVTQIENVHVSDTGEGEFWFVLRDAQNIQQGQVAADTMNKIQQPQMENILDADVCKTEAIITPPEPIEPLPTTVNEDLDYWIIGAVIGPVVFLSIILILCCWRWKRGGPAGQRKTAPAPAETIEMVDGKPKPDFSPSDQKQIHETEIITEKKASTIPLFAANNNNTLPHDEMRRSQRRKVRPGSNKRQYGRQNPSYPDERIQEEDDVDEDDDDDEDEESDETEEEIVIVRRPSPRPRRDEDTRRQREPDTRRRLAYDQQDTRRPPQKPARLQPLEHTSSATPPVRAIQRSPLQQSSPVPPINDRRPLEMTGNVMMDDELRPIPVQKLTHSAGELPTFGRIQETRGLTPNPPVRFRTNIENNMGAFVKATGPLPVLDLQQTSLVAATPKPNEQMDPDFQHKSEVERMRNKQRQREAMFGASTPQGPSPPRMNKKQQDEIDAVLDPDNTKLNLSQRKNRLRKRLRRKNKIYMQEPSSKKEDILLKSYQNITTPRKETQSIASERTNDAIDSESGSEISMREANRRIKTLIDDTFSTLKKYKEQLPDQQTGRLSSLKRGDSLTSSTPRKYAGMSPSIPEPAPAHGRANTMPPGHGRPRDVAAPNPYINPVNPYHQYPGMYNDPMVTWDPVERQRYINQRLGYPVYGPVASSLTMPYGAGGPGQSVFMTPVQQRPDGMGNMVWSPYAGGNESLVTSPIKQPGIPTATPITGIAPATPHTTTLDMNDIGELKKSTSSQPLIRAIKEELLKLSQTANGKTKITELQPELTSETTDGR